MSKLTKRQISVIQKELSREADPTDHEVLAQIEIGKAMAERGSICESLDTLAPYIHHMLAELGAIEKEDGDLMPWTAKKSIIKLMIDECQHWEKEPREELLRSFRVID